MPLRTCVLEAVQLGPMVWLLNGLGGAKAVGPGAAAAAAAAATPAAAATAVKHRRCAVGI